MAAYETPVSDRMWHLAATGSTPAPVLQTLLHHLAEGGGWETAVGGPVDEKTVTAATKPLNDAGWKHTVDGRWIRWTNLAEDAGVQKPNSTLATLTVWAGPSIDHPTWPLTASPHTPSSLLAADLTDDLLERLRDPLQREQQRPRQYVQEQRRSVVHRWQQQHRLPLVFRR
ncbi:DUF317 domain-containing protein [Streptomyces sp. NPDC005262]|uniref:DUF317 domain-containing protein n=1 Tax=Streptomyces sp. NPDC005262 TaxID=3364710 RepID=UPI00369A3E31